MDLKLSTFRIFVSDLQQSTRFYQINLGLTLNLVNERLGWAEFSFANSQRLGLEELSPEDPEYDTLVGRFIGLSFSVQNIFKAYDLLINNEVGFVTEPALQPWGGHLAHFCDPDGNILTLTQYKKV